MIVLFTDFGWQGPYVGQMKAVLAQQAPDQTVIDLMHDAPVFNSRAAAYLLASLVEPFPKDTVFLAVVDPGVGSGERRPCVLQADGRWYVGPDNGLFNVIAKQSAEYTAWVIDWQPDSLSDSFHGRDLFAPVAAQLASGQLPADDGNQPGARSAGLAGRSGGGYLPGFIWQCHDWLARRPYQQGCGTHDKWYPDQLCACFCRGRKRLSLSGM